MTLALVVIVAMAASAVDVGKAAQLLVWIGVALAVVLLVALGVVAWKAWTFSQWMGSELERIVLRVQGSAAYQQNIESIVERSRYGEHFRKATAAAMADPLALSIGRAIQAHNDDPASHPNYQRQVDSVMRVFVGEAVNSHDHNRAAHHTVFRDYPDRDELQGAINRLESTIAGQNNLVVERLNNLGQRVSELHEYLMKREK